MIKVIKQDGNTINYTCSCGAKGICSFKPANKETAIVLSIVCPSCNDTERVTLLQYNSESSKIAILNNLDSVDLSWVLSINEEILQEDI